MFGDSVHQLETGIVYVFSIKPYLLLTEMVFNICLHIYRLFKDNDSDPSLSCRTEKDRIARLNHRTAGKYIIQIMLFTYMQIYMQGF